MSKKNKSKSYNELLQAIHDEHIKLLMLVLS
jgi:hypothetical protein